MKRLLLLPLLLVLSAAACSSRSDTGSGPAPAGSSSEAEGFALCGCDTEDAGCVEPKDMPVNGPAQCQSDSDCPAGEACTAEFADTFMCSLRCDPDPAADAAACPVGYSCVGFVP